MGNIHKKIVIFSISLFVAIAFTQDALAQSAMIENANIGKVSIDCAPFFHINDFFIRRLPRFLHYSIDIGVMAMLEEQHISLDNVIFVNVRYQNAPLVPAERNTPVIKSFYKRFEEEQNTFLKEFCIGENDLDIVIFWDPGVLIDQNNKVIAAIAAYDRTNNSINFEQLEIAYEMMKDANQVKTLITEYIKKFGDKIIRFALRRTPYK